MKRYALLASFLLLSGILGNINIANAIETSGRIEMFGAGYLYNKEGSKKEYGEIRFLPEVMVTFGRFSAYCMGDFQQDTDEYANGCVDDIIEEEQRWAGNIKEVYIEYISYISDDLCWLRFGKIIFDWAATDTVSPSDNINPRDWKDVIRREKVGLPAVSVRYGRDTFIEAVYLPFFSPSKLPEGRWKRDLPLGLVGGEQEILSRGHPQFAVLVGTIAWDCDLGASFYKGYSYSPSFKLEPISVSAAELIPVYCSEEVYALSAAKSIAGFDFRAEAGYFRQENEDDFIQCVLGADREWNEVFGLTDTLYVLVQYVDEEETQHDAPVPFKTIDFRRVFNNAAMGRIKYSPDGDKWSFKLEGSYNFSEKDYYIQPSVGWEKANFEIEGGIDVLGGPKDSFFGGYNRNDRTYIKIVWHF
jgi:hypothetical protein